MSAELAQHKPSIYSICVHLSGPVLQQCATSCLNTCFRFLQPWVSHLGSLCPVLYTALLWGAAHSVPPTGVNRIIHLDAVLVD
jgi:hypothetical protein